MDLYVGANCVWYSHADVNHTPSVGIVTAIKQPGVLTLYLFPGSGGMPRMVDNCYHVDSERLQDNRNIRVEYGGWDTVEAAEERRQLLINLKKRPVEAAPPEPEEQADVEEHVRIMDLYDNNVTLDEIAKQMGEGWGLKKVSKVIKEHAQATA
tara:strand:- start:233 stop:691 length:459 start_codon:yes stop_codon:yes gene_type:complete